MEMDEYAMIDLSLLPLSVTLPVFLLGGLVLGYAYFRAVRATADLVISQGNPLHAAALTLGRLALLSRASTSQSRWAVSRFWRPWPASSAPGP
jgi:hypothetical protein